MARYYFDLHDSGSVIYPDDVGEELPSDVAARDVAVQTIGQMAGDFTRRHLEGRISVEVRDGDGPILRFSATLKLTPLRKPPH